MPVTNVDVREILVDGNGDSKVSPILESCPLNALTDVELGELIRAAAVIEPSAFGYLCAFKGETCSYFREAIAGWRTGMKIKCTY